jgi:hypothetical protein
MVGTYGVLLCDIPTMSTEDMAFFITILQRLCAESPYRMNTEIFGGYAWRQPGVRRASQSILSFATILVSRHVARHGKEMDPAARPGCCSDVLRLKIRRCGSAVFLRGGGRLLGSVHTPGRSDPLHRNPLDRSTSDDTGSACGAWGPGLAWLACTGACVDRLHSSEPTKSFTTKDVAPLRPSSQLR